MELKQHLENIRVEIAEALKDKKLTPFEFYSICVLVARSVKEFIADFTAEHPGEKPTYEQVRAWLQEAFDWADADFGIIAAAEAYDIPWVPQWLEEKIEGPTYHWLAGEVLNRLAHLLT